MIMIISLLLLGMIFESCEATVQRSFVIDNATNVFMKDGKPFRYISCGMHYFRVREEDWEDRFVKMRKAGCNAIQFVIPWNVHETYQGNYINFDKLVKFIKLAQAHDLLVLVRPGPYICAEWEFGGFPYWLLKNKAIKLRTSDKIFMSYVEKWMSVLLPALAPLLYSNGGPIIMVQIENEYGSYGCDHEYIAQLEALFKSHLGDNVIYYTTDGDGDSYLKCGTIPSLFSTVDFGAGGDTAAAFQVQRKYQPHGPAVNSEYYPGWLDHWGQPHQTRDADFIGNYFEKILAYNASVNMYMFEGGTSFGFMNGANAGVGSYSPQPTSYDYDSPLSEAGDPRPKYFILQYIMSKYVNLPPGPQPVASEKGAYGKFDAPKMIQFYDLIDKAKPVENPTPLSFESLDAPYGYVLYRTSIPAVFENESQLNVTLLKYHDRASIFVDNELQEILNINKPEKTVSVKSGKLLDILIENQGRVNYGSLLMDTEEGILDDVLINGVKLMNWKMYHIDGEASILNSTQLPTNNVEWFSASTNETLLPFIANFTFNIDEVKDTYLKLDAWTKGFVNINGFNLGRYWTPAGPQKTLYVPRHVLTSHNLNSLIIFETDKIPKDLYIEFVDKAILGSQSDTIPVGAYKTHRTQI